jgi:hypothetical protein
MANKGPGTNGFVGHERDIVFAQLMWTSPGRNSISLFGQRRTLTRSTRSLVNWLVGKAFLTRWKSFR